jgi:outer membrane protein assembly factor BamE (lipoprotein component of BamABCDE complex)
VILKVINSKAFLFAFFMGVVVSLPACSPMTSTHGNVLEETRTSQIKVGSSTRDDVFRALGSPTTVAPFDSNTWYYMGQKMEKKGIFDPEIVDEKIIVVQFNDQNIVQKFETLQQDRLNVPLKDNKTPTYGNEISAIQQMLGNLGKFNAKDPE